MSNTASNIRQHPGPLLLLLRQGMGFSMVGLLQLLLDWGVMVGLSAMGMPMAPSNVLGRLAGAALGFWGNGRLTFAGSRLPLWRSAFRFVLLWSALTLLSTLALEEVAMQRSLDTAWLIKPLVEGALSLVSFFACRHWVFGHRGE